MNFYQNKVVWVTGASSGIGEALVPELLANGAHVILSARRENELKRVFDKNGADSDRMFILPLDLTQHDTLADATEKAINWRSRIDILINNGGVSQRAFAHQTRLDIEKRLFDVNYFGTIELTRLVLPGMIEKGSGRIVVVSSVLGKLSVPLRSSYCASKHALHGYFDALRAELHQSGIKVTMVCPGYIKTQVSVNALSPDGTPHARMDDTQARGMHADVFARKMLQKMARGYEEFNIGGPEIYGIWIKRLFPWLVSRIVRKATPSITHQ
jgi:dehydrogenase/reductase SDR family member 7B